MLNTKEGNKGITLIALIITIIVLLILSGVTIAMLTGGDSAPAKANEAKQKTDIGTAKDQIALLVENARLEAYDDIYVNGNTNVSMSNASNTVGQRVIDDVLAVYGTSKTIGSATILVEQASSGQDAGITISSRDVTEKGVISAKGGELIWDSIPISSLQDENTKPYLPTGFKVSKESADAEDPMEEGLIITDAGGNEYVWVEVPRTIYSNELQAITPDATLTDAQYTAIETAMISYASSYRNDLYSDTYNTSMGTIGNITNADDYNTLKKKMLKSVFDNGGFYVGRYEAGIEVADARTDLTDPISDTLVPVSKANFAPINYVTCDQAQTLATRVSSGEYTSSLMFGIQWDLMIKYLEVKTGSAVTEFTENSGSWGNYTNVSFNVNSSAKGYNFDTKVYEDINPNIKPAEYDEGEGNNNTPILLTTGATKDAESPDNNRNSKANIFDVAGNEYEWTLEYTSRNGIPFCCRGGSFRRYSSEWYVSRRRTASVGFSNDGAGIRVALY